MKNNNRKILSLFLMLSIVITFFSSCEVECTTRVENMKVFSVSSDSTAETTSWIPGWYRSEFQNGKLHFSIEFDHFVGGQGKCNWVWENYPIESSIELIANRTLYTELDTIYNAEPLIDYFDIEAYEYDNNYITYLLTEKSDQDFIFTREYYTFIASIKTDDGLDMIDSCIVKIVD